MSGCVGGVADSQNHPQALLMVLGSNRREAAGFRKSCFMCGGQMGAVV